MKNWTRRRFLGGTSAMLGLSFRAGAHDIASNDALVTTETANGRLQGLLSGRIAVFKGVPYAADTGGANRFMAPRPVENWAGVRAATTFGARSPQDARGVESAPDGEMGSPRYGEDCCVLNVFTPSINRNARRPVMVFVHGGGFRSGSGDAPTFDGRNLAAFGEVVVVTLNRRLNVLGFAALGSLGEDYADAANAGQLDLVAALQWVQANIESFGGDPSRVTLFGHSGGGSSIEILSIMPAARGLYHRTINMSGSSAFTIRAAEDLAPVAETFASSLGAGRGRMHLLAEFAPDRLRAAYDAALVAHGLPAGDFRPVVDGRFIPHSPLTAGALAIGGHVPGIMSVTATEASAWLGADARNLTVPLAQVQTRVAAHFGISEHDAAQVLAAYREDSPARSPWDLLVAVTSDALVRIPQRRAIEIKAAAGLAPVYACEFAWLSPNRGGHWGAPHGIDVPCAFATMDANDLTREAPGIQEVSLAQMSAFVAMAHDGDPGNRAMPGWTPFNTAERPTMVINRTCALVADYRPGDRRAGEMLPAQDAMQVLAGPIMRFIA